MEVEDLWKQFVASGKIADYLRFVNGSRSEVSQELSTDYAAEANPEHADRMAEADREDKILGAAFPARKMPDVTVPGVAVSGETLEKQIRLQMTEDEEAEDGI